MLSSNQSKDEAVPGATKSLRVDDAGYSSAALRGAALAFTSYQIPPKSSGDRVRINNGALVAASVAGQGRGTSVRQSSTGTLGGSDPENSPKQSIQYQTRQKASINYSGIPSRKTSFSSRRASPSQIAAVIAVTSSSPMPPQYASRRPYPLKRAHSDLPISPPLNIETSPSFTRPNKTNTPSGRPSPQECPNARSHTMIVSPTPIRPSKTRLSLRSTLPSNLPTAPEPNQKSKISTDTAFLSIAASASTEDKTKAARPLATRSQSAISFEDRITKPPLYRTVSPRTVPPSSGHRGMLSASGSPVTSSSASSYASALDDLGSQSHEIPPGRLPRSASDSLSTLKAQNKSRYNTEPRGPWYPPIQKAHGFREPTLSTTSLVPQLTADSLANAIVASSLASSRAPSPTRPHLPPPRRHSKQHHLFHRTKSTENASRSPSPAKQMRQTLRRSKESEGEDLSKRHRSHFIKKHPNKHHEGDRKRWRDTVSEIERKRFEGLWAANKNLLMTSANSTSNAVCNIIVRDIWRRSRLPDDVLEEIWELVDIEREGTLEREEFVVGMWLIDQRLKGRKLPVKVSESVWGSVRMLSGIKVRKHQR